MKYGLLLLSLLALVFSVMVYGGAKSSIHEIYAAIMLLVAAVLLSGAAIVAALDRAINYAAAEVDKELNPAREGELKRDCAHCGADISRAKSSICPACGKINLD